ncbi:unnamed protein product, partial [Ectocarpus sp. 12 AP-2014]
MTGSNIFRTRYGFDHYSLSIRNQNLSQTYIRKHRPSGFATVQMQAECEFESRHNREFFLTLKQTTKGFSSTRKSRKTHRSNLLVLSTSQISSNINLTNHVCIDT